MPQSAALIPVSPTSVPLNQRFCHSCPETVWLSTPFGAPFIACMPTKSAASQPDSRNAVYSVHSLLDDELAVGVEQVGHERVERPAAAGAVAVHDDDLGRTGRLRAAHGGVDLLGVEPPPFLVHRVAAARLLPLDDAGDAFHVADDVNLHAR